jgi:hypothetical protein
MQFAIVGDHRDHFQQEGYVEFEAVLSDQEIAQARQALAASLPRKPRSAWECLQFGRDLWRSHSFLRKTACARRLGRVAADLAESGPLRLAYDQLLGFGGGRHASESQAAFFRTPWSLREKSAFQTVICGLVVALTDSPATSPQLPRIAGHGVYLRADRAFDWSELLTLSGAEYWLFVYGIDKLVYIVNLADPHAHRPKDYGYGIGDRLRDVDYPLVHLALH